MELEYEVESGNFETVGSELFSNESLLEMETTYEKLLIEESDIVFCTVALFNFFMFLFFSISGSYIVPIEWLHILGGWYFIMTAIFSMSFYRVFKGFFNEVGSYICLLLTKNTYCEKTAIEGLFSEKNQEEMIECISQDLMKANTLLVGVEMSKKELRKNKGLVKELKHQIKHVKSVVDKKIVVRGFFELNRLRKRLVKMIDKYQSKVVIQEQEVEKLSLVKLL